MDYFIIFVSNERWIYREFDTIEKNNILFLKYIIK